MSPTREGCGWPGFIPADGRLLADAACDDVIGGDLVSHVFILDAGVLWDCGQE